MSKAKLNRLLAWHKREQYSLSAFGSRAATRIDHEIMQVAVTQAIGHLELMAKALLALPAYKSHDTDAFSTNHKEALNVAKLYGVPPAKVKVTKEKV